MAIKHKYLYLYLALACLLGIIIIFVFDGYMGLHDTLTYTNGEVPEKINEDEWQVREDSGYIPSLYLIYGENVTFTYQLDNRRFSSYETDISVSVWNNQVKITDLLSTTITIKAFGKEQADWVFNTTQFASGILTSGTPAHFTLVIQRGDIQRKMIIDLYESILQMKNPQ